MVFLEIILQVAVLTLQMLALISPLIVVQLSVMKVPVMQQEDLELQVVALYT